MEDEIHKMPGPLLLLAGPGTGKTYRLVKRIKFLVEEQNVEPQNITVITFTASATRNMHERISDVSNNDVYIPPTKQPKMIRTMHSLGYKIFRESELGVDENVKVVYSDSLRNILVEDAAQLIGFNRNNSKEVVKCRQFGNCKPSRSSKCRICEQYQNILRSCSAVDYDEQILLACKILKGNPELLRKYRMYCQHLLIDEYQDINAGQFNLICLLSEGQHEGLFAVGDDDQSIYSWRGGSPEFIRGFKEHFGSKSKIRSLKKSFRCHRHVLEGALSVVTDYDKNRLQKDDFEYKKENGCKINVHNVPSDEKEAIVVKSIIERVLPSKSILILVPHRGFTRSIIEKLRKARIQYSAPLTLPGEGLPLISTLYQWLIDNSDSLSFRECLESFINNPNSDIPSERSRKPEKKEEREKDLLKISRLWKNVIEKKTNNLWDALELEKESDELYSKSFSAFDKIRSLKDSNKDPADFIVKVVETIVPWKKTQSFLDEINLWVETSKQMDITSQGMVFN